VVVIARAVRSQVCCAVSKVVVQAQPDVSEGPNMSSRRSLVSNALCCKRLACLFRCAELDATEQHPRGLVVGVCCIRSAGGHGSFVGCVIIVDTYRINRGTIFHASVAVLLSALVIG